MTNQVPAKFAKAAQVLDEIKSKKISFKRAFASLEVNFHEKDKRPVFALVSQTLKNQSAIEKMKKLCLKSAPKEEKLNDSLLEIAICKTVFDKKTHVYNIPIRVPEFKIAFDLRKSLRELKEPAREKDELDHVYLRINKLKTRIKEIIGILESQEFQYVDEKFDSFDSFIEFCKSMKNYQFIRDYHFRKEILVFRKATLSPLLDFDIYKEGKVLIQDKASLLAIHSMSLKKRMFIVDACCAPGTKTAAIASKLKNKVRIVSIDRDKTRMGEMKVLIDKLGVSCVEMINADFIDFAKNFPYQEPIDVLLLDPTCSGSGRPDISEENVDHKRRARLSGLQIVLLKAALSLNPKRLIYSTCSQNTFENERVVYRALQESENGDKYQIIDPDPEWPMRGDSSFPFGVKCIRSDKNYLTRGFFICCLEMISDKQQNQT